MKKLMFTIWLLGIVSCTPLTENHSNNQPTATKVIESQPNNRLTATPEIERATATVTTSLRQIKSTSTGILTKEYDSTKWELIYDRDMVWQIDISPMGEMWIKLDRGEIAFFDKDRWVLFSSQDYGFKEIPHDMAIAPDGAVWIAGRHAISRYKNGRWDVFPIPNASETASTYMAIDPSGKIWITTPLCYCEKSIKRFDGTRWNEFSITDKHLEAWQLVFTPNGILWTSFGMSGSLGNYDGKTWEIFSGTGLWPNEPNNGAEIAADDRGNIYSISDNSEWIVRISKDGVISRIPYDFLDLELNPALMRLFIDKQDTIWINACLKNKRDACLAYYKDGRWVSFINLPFSVVTHINEIPNGTLLVATEKGLYRFRPDE